MESPIISLCLPTNGVIEWVFPVLDSIYAQDADLSLYEVVVTDNGQNDAFYQRMTRYAQEHENLIYRKTDAVLFHNQLEALKLARGQFLKLINHRSPLVEGALAKMIDLVRTHSAKKPVIYMANGSRKESYYCKTFDEFVRNLGSIASWTGGVGIWKSDYDSLPQDLRIDRISPHSCILFSVRKDRDFLIDNSVFCRELDKDHSKKGSYDLFKAFGVEELAITQNLFIDGDITADTLKAVKKEYGRFVSSQYLDFCIQKHPCSYNLDGFDDAMGIYFNKKAILINAYWMACKAFLSRLKNAIPGVRKK